METFKSGQEYFFIFPELGQCIETPLARFFTRHPEDDIEDNEEPWNPDMEDQCEIATSNGLVKTCTPALPSSDSYDASAFASFHSLPPRPLGNE